MKIKQRGSEHRIVVLAIFVACLAPRAGAQKHTQPPRSVAQVVSAATPAVVVIRTYDSAGHAVALGSGFITSDGRIVTNAHVLAGAATVEVRGSDGQLLMTTQFVESISQPSDIAILSKPGTIPGKLSLHSARPAVGEKVIVIGAPQGLSNTVSDGIVSAIRRVDDRTLLQITAPLSHGSSGGPVLNARGEVLGVSVAMLTEGQNLNFAVPTADISALLSSPPGHYSFPGAMTPLADPSSKVGSAENNPVTGASPSRRGFSTLADFLAYASQLIPVASTSYGNTHLRFLGCFHAFDGSPSALCLFRVVNTEMKEKSRFFIHGASLTDQSGLVGRPTSIFFSQQNRSARLPVNWNLEPGSQELIGVTLVGIPANSTGGMLAVDAQAGWTGPRRTVTFANSLSLSPP